jgi:hypothetical protein
MKTPLCNSNKYFTNKGYIFMPVTFSNLPATIEVEGDTLLVKTTFHVSLICVKDIVALYGETIPDIEQKIQDVFCEFVGTHTLTCTLSKTFRLAEKEEKKTLVVMCSVSNLDLLYEKIRAELSIELENQPTHVTLYTKQLDAGIGLNNPKMLEELSKVVQISIDDILLK